MQLKVIPGSYSIVKLSPAMEIPPKVYHSKFLSITRTDEELSIVCESHLTPKSGNFETDFELIKVQGPLDFSLTGILASLASPLADAKISIFSVSTFDTDYLLVRSKDV